MSSARADLEARALPAFRARLGVQHCLGIAASGIAFAGYLLTMSATINFIDSGEFITVAVTAGIPHPPVYPLYTLLSIAAGAVPIGSAAVRLNFLSVLAGTLGVAL